MKPLKDDQLSLNKLYKSETVRQTVYTILSDEFDYVFDSLINEAKNLKSLLYVDAQRNKIDIKEMFIQYGFPMETLSQLKDILKTIKEWNNIDDIDHGNVTSEWDCE